MTAQEAIKKLEALIPEYQKTQEDGHTLQARLHARGCLAEIRDMAAALSGKALDNHERGIKRAQWFIKFRTEPGFNISHPAWEDQIDLNTYILPPEVVDRYRKGT